ncbi:hypothetical protein [Noviherbaspirillum malthae]|uniref:hypothetical protein n=1 Tax=Noviherbaspirillum malthae TaxID=1260987 RepID=UPI00188F475A|nr:hypothetical protein [Noviherbaspirillum malthae]
MRKKKRGGAGAPWVFDGPYDPYRQLLYCMSKLKFCLREAQKESPTATAHQYDIELSIIELKLRDVWRAMLKCPEIADEFNKLSRQYPFERLDKKTPEVGGSDAS